MKNLLKSTLTSSIASLSSLTLTTSMAVAGVSFIELPIEDRVGGGHGWIEVSDTGKVVFAKYKENGQEGPYGLREMEGFSWSQSEGVQLISTSFSVTGTAPHYVSIDNDGDTTVFGNNVYRNGQLVLTTNTGADKTLHSLSPDGQLVSINSYYDGGPTIQNIDTQVLTPIGSEVPNSNYYIADFSNNSQTLLVASSSVNFHDPDPFYLRQPDGSYYEIPQAFGSIADLSGNGSTVIGRSTSCEQYDSCTIISNAASSTEIGVSNYFPEGLNYDASIAVLSYRDYENNDWQGFIWDNINGLRNISEVLSTHGIDISDWTQVRMYDISDNGHFIIGEGKNASGIYKTFMIDATPQCSPNSLI